MTVVAAPTLFASPWIAQGGAVPPSVSGDDVTLSFSASHALWQGLHGLGLQRGDKILFPAYHCGIELDVCLKAGLEVTFYEVDSALAIRWADVRRLVDSRTRALFVIHYFGFPMGSADAQALCEEMGLILIEDCAHALYRVDDTRRVCGQKATMAIFSLRKFLPVPEGGALRLAGGGSRTVPPPSGETIRMLRIEAQRALAGQELSAGRRWLARAVKTAGLPAAVWHRAIHGRVPPRANDPSLDFSVSGSEWGMSAVSRWIVEHTDHAAVVARRRRNYQALSERLSGQPSVRLLYPVLPEGVCPWLCPVVVDNADGLIETLRRRDIEAAPLWREAHPRWPAERFPAARRLKAQTVALPIHQDVSLEQVRMIAEEVTQWAMRALQ